MKNLRDDPSRIVILGGGRGGTAMAEMLNDEALATVVGMVDYDDQAPGMLFAKEHGIATYHSAEEALKACAPCVAFNLTNNEMVEEIASGILGAGGVVGGLEARLMWRMVTDLKHAKKDLEYQATHDPLTGLRNRRYVNEQMEREISQAIRYGLEFSLVLIDLDHFKLVNDEHGHAAGDMVLKRVSLDLQQSVRASDIIGRWGGEEFVVLLPHTNVAAASAATRQWLQRVQSTPIDLAEGEALTVSFSAGVAALHAEEGKSLQEHIDALLAAADKYLYQAKDCGRACVIGEVASS